MAETNFSENIGSLLFPDNIILKTVVFFVYGIITSLPYLFKNLSSINRGDSSAIGYYLTQVGKGFLIGLSTIYNSLLNIQNIISQRMITTALLTLFLLIFTTITLYQFADLFIRITDLGKSFSPVSVGVLSLLVVIVLSPLASVITDGKTVGDTIQEKIESITNLEIGQENMPLIDTTNGGVSPNGGN